MLSSSNKFNQQRPNTQAPIGKSSDSAIMFPSSSNNPRAAYFGVSSALDGSSHVATSTKGPASSYFSETSTLSLKATANSSTALKDGNLSHSAREPWSKLQPAESQHISVGPSRSSSSNNPTPFTSQPTFSNPQLSQVLQNPSTSKSSMSIAEQESVLIEDLLYVLTGIDGVYILSDRATQPSALNGQMTGWKSRFPPQGLSYSIDTDIEVSLSSLAQRIIPLATHYTTVQSYIDSHSEYLYGRVCQAIAAAMRGLLKEYFVLVAQLERQFRGDPSFSLQQLWYHVSPTMATMKSLAALAEALREAEKPLPPAPGEVRAWGEKEPLRLGGVLLTLLVQRMNKLGGDTSTRTLYIHLLRCAAIPFFDILRNWIHRGDLVDQCNEFMIQENRKHTKANLRNDILDAYWSQRYVLRDGAVPPFLEKWADRILTAGKYWNVIKECGGDPEKDGRIALERYRDGEGVTVDSSPGDDLLRAIGATSIVEEIETAYLSANRLLLARLMNEEHLVDRIRRSIKRFFLLDQSDFITHFFDLASTELAKSAAEVSVSRLQNLFDLAVRNPAGVGSNDPYRDDLKVEMSRTTLVDMVLRISMIQGETLGLDREKQMERIKQNAWGSIEPVHRAVLTGLDAFNLTLTTNFPVTLVLNLRALTMYQLLFRHLMICKHVERSLSTLWSEQISEKSKLWGLRQRSVDPTSDLASFSARPESAVSNSEKADQVFETRMYTLRAQMLDLIRQVLYYVCFEVVEPNWRDMEANLLRAKTVDELLKKHEDFLETCLKESMLTQESLLKIFNKLTVTALYFCNFADWHNRNRRQYNTLSGDAGVAPAFSFPEFLLPPSSPSLARSLALSSSYSKVNTLDKFETTFAGTAQLLIDALRFFASTETARLGGLASRMDYNQFYSRGAPSSSTY
ncbi:Gamma-tubulin complex component 2 [Gonapodya sp. JEL0774]|nr:Gamma-tubulin complex component 2 [Gonapodya sp. JEL0774]